MRWIIQPSGVFVNYVRRFLILMPVLIGAIFVLWKFRYLEPVIWRFYLSVPSVQTVSRSIVKRRPANLPGYLLNGDRRLREILIDGVEKERISLEISKSGYKLTVLYDNNPIKDYAVVFGNERTPEGRFRVRDLYRDGGWSRFIWLNYRDKASSVRFGIHGVPSGGDGLVDDGINWTAGGVSLKTADVNEVYSIIQADTRVAIKH